MRPHTIALLSLLALGAVQAPARAATVEPRVQLLVREKPSANARIVDRVAAGKKLQMLGRTADGGWTHVQSGRKEGWVPSAQLKGNVKGRKANVDEEEAPAEEEDDKKPLAKRRSVRPEAWVSASRYHDGEDNKLTVSAIKAELYGRPQATGSVLGILRRGEVVSLVRKSADKKWVLVDIGGGDVAWLEAKAVKPGSVKGAPTVASEEPAAEEEAPPPPTKKGGKKFVAAEPEPEPEPAPASPPKGKKIAKAEAPPEPAPEPEPAPPTPAAIKKSKRQQKAEAAEAERLAAEEREKAAARDAALDDELAPGMGGKKVAKAEEKKQEPAAEETPPPKKGKKNTRLASRGDLSGVEGSVSRRPPGPPHSNNYFGVGVRGGIALIEQRFTSNASGPLTNYAGSTGAFGVQVGAAYQRAIGRYFRLGIDASYAGAFAGGVRYRTNSVDAMGNAVIVLLGVQTHTIDVGVAPGVWLNVIGGLGLRLRIGGEMQLNLIRPDTRVPLPSDRVLGMTIGLGIDAPALFYLANRPFGAHVYAGGLVPADRAQTIGLEEGATSQTFGFMVGGSLSYGLYKGLGLEVAYSYSAVATEFRGQAKRNLNITAASRGSAQNLIMLGLSYNL